jgi:hypothetical protein
VGGCGWDQVVPALVVSGFMNGIASLIWLREVGSLLGFTPRRNSFDLLIGFEGADPLEGDLPWVRTVHSPWLQPAASGGLFLRGQKEC